jgi:hypothetical protein
MIGNGFWVSPADRPGPSMVVPRTIGNCAIRRPGEAAAGPAIWEPEELATCGAGRRGAYGGPDVAPEWAQVRRAGARHDVPHG